MNEKEKEELKEKQIDCAWGLIANVSGGDWTEQARDWQRAAIKWRDEIFPTTKPKKSLSDKISYKPLAYENGDVTTMGRLFIPDVKEAVKGFLDEMRPDGASIPNNYKLAKKHFGERLI